MFYYVPECLDRLICSALFYLSSGCGFDSRCTWRYKLHLISVISPSGMFLDLNTFHIILCSNFSKSFSKSTKHMWCCVLDSGFVGSEARLFLPQCWGHPNVNAFGDYLSHDFVYYTGFVNNSSGLVSFS